MCKIQEREYLIYRRVYFAMKGGWIMSEKKLRNITDALCFLMILGEICRRGCRSILMFMGSRTGMGRRGAFFWSRFWGCWSWHFWCSVRDFHSGGIIRLRWQRRTESISLRSRQKWFLWSSCYPLEYVFMLGSAGIWERHLCGRCGYWSQGCL